MLKNTMPKKNFFVRAKLRSDMPIKLDLIFLQKMKSFLQIPTVGLLRCSHWGCSKGANLNLYICWTSMTYILLIAKHYNVIHVTLKYHIFIHGEWCHPSKKIFFILFGVAHWLELCDLWQNHCQIPGTTVTGTGSLSFLRNNLWPWLAFIRECRAFSCHRHESSHSAAHCSGLQLSFLATLCQLSLLCSSGMQTYELCKELIILFFSTKLSSIPKNEWHSVTSVKEIPFYPINGCVRKSMATKR